MKAIASNIEGYYRLHARIYDATRWSFLFGRGDILRHIPSKPKRILEVGCGTGRNIAALARRYPRAHITGVDLSGAMLTVARNKTGEFGIRILLQQRRYDAPLGFEHGFDLILFSYALSMFNPGFEAALAAAHADLAPGGYIAVVDFNGSTSARFKRWMAVNHVRMDGHLLPQLRARFVPAAEHHRPAYHGLWHYFMFIGRKG